jgi:hypothetical protein
LSGKKPIEPSGNGFASETLRVIRLAPEPVSVGQLVVAFEGKKKGKNV